MREEENKFKKIFGSKITLFMLLLGIIWLSVNLANVYYKRHQLSKEVEDLKAQMGALEKSNQEISNLIDYFSSQSFIEKQAKEKLNLKKEGEEVVVIQPPKESPATSTQPVTGENIVSIDQSSDSQIKTESNFVKWWKYFFR